MAERKPIPKDVEERVLTQSRRRCCMCWGLNGDQGTKKGQITHLDHNPGNNDFDNLAWMCLDHHADYDAKSTQTKGYTRQEAKTYRDALYVTPVGEAQDGVSVIKDSKFSAEVKDAKEAYVMEVNGPAVLSNVQASLRVTGNVEKAATFTTNQSLRVIMASCSRCGGRVPVTCTGRPPVIRVRCPSCGAENEIKP